MLVLEIIILVYVAPLVVYNFVFGVASVFPMKVKTKAPKDSKEVNFAVLIPAYKEDAVIVDVAKRALEQSYPSQNYDVVIIADQLQPQTLSNLRELPIKVVEVFFEKSTKSKALNKAMADIGDGYDMAVILDADNVMDFHFLEKVSNAFQQGHTVIQGRRVAKNTENNYSFLDGISEAINNNIFRKGHNNLGFSCSFIGSGMALPYAGFKKQMLEVNAVGGFDRALQAEYIEKGSKINYLDDCVVYDEKISTSGHFENQRRRWLSSQYVYLAKNFSKGLKQLGRGNLDYFNAAVLHNLFLPRVLNLGILMVYGLLAVLLRNYLEMPLYFHLGFVGAYYLATFLAIPSRYLSIRLFAAILKVPQTFFIMFGNLFKLKGANKNFIHTEHKQVQLEQEVKK